MPLTFESAEEREFWKQVYVQACKFATFDAAAGLADNAVEALRKRVPAPPAISSLEREAFQRAMNDALTEQIERTTAAAPLSDGPKPTAAQADSASYQHGATLNQQLAEKYLAGRAASLSAHQFAQQADPELAEFFARPVKVHVR